MTVIVARRDDTFSQLLRDAGIEVVNLELIATKVLDALDDFENVIARLDGYDGVFVTSPVAAQVFVDRVKRPVRATFYALGGRAADVLGKGGFDVRQVPHANTAEEMLAVFGDAEFAGKKLLFIGGERSMRTIPEKLGRIADVDEIAVYRTTEIEPKADTAVDIRRSLESREMKWICFFSPSAVDAFETKFGTTATVAAIGETTASRASELGFEVGLIASRARNEVFASELIARLAD